METETVKDENNVKFKRKITLVNAIGLIVGSMIGSGIFLTPKGVFEYTGQSAGLSIAVWIFCGVFSMIGAFCYSELGTSISRSGGDYVYQLEAFGRLVAFLYLWMSMLVINPASQAICSLTFAYYTLSSVFRSCEPPEVVVKLLAICCLCTATDLIHRPFHREKETGVEHLSLAIYSGLFAFGGWNYINFVTQELKNPEKNLPIAIIGGTLLVTLVYVLTNVAYFVVLTGDEILASPSIAALFALKTISYLSWITPITVAISAIGGLNGAIFVSARLACIAAEERQIPSILGMIDIDNCTPKPALIITCLIAIITLMTGNVFQLVNYFSFSVWLWTGVSTAAQTYLRFKKPNLKRPTKVCIGFPILFSCLCLSLTIVSILASPWNAAIGLLIIATGLPVFYLQSKISQNSCRKPLQLLQKLFLVASTRTTESDENIAHL